MSRPIAVLRPEPGNRVTAAAIEAHARRAVRLPLFDVAPVAWDAAEPAGFDALILTSANALRHGGPALAALTALPVYAVGEATAEAATRAGFAVAATGSDGAAGIVSIAGRAGVRHALHLAGRERTLEPGGIVAAIRTVYATATRAISPADLASLRGTVAMLHSPRAAARLAELLDPEARTQVRLAAVSSRALKRAGPGWEAATLAAAPTNAALVEAALALAD